LGQLPYCKFLAMPGNIQVSGINSCMAGNCNSSNMAATSALTCVSNLHV